MTKIINSDYILSMTNIIPNHIAIIMDGNGRWAQSRDASLMAGYRAGADVAKKICKAAVRQNIKYLTFYTFSSENWLRPKSWVNDLMGLLRHYLSLGISDLDQNNVRLRVIGDRARLPVDIAKLIDAAEQKTQNNTGLNLQLAISYGSREEILNACRSIAKKCVDGDLSLAEINENAFESELYTAGIPDPDLLIRTSGEQRISNYLLWQLAYTEFYFTNTLWPDFSEAEFVKAIEIFQTRERRYGASIGKSAA